MRLLDRIAAARTSGRELEKRYSADQWLTEYLIPSLTQFNYNGTTYPGGVGQLNQTLLGKRATEISSTLPGYMSALRACPPAFAAQMVRALVLSQARFTFRNLPSSNQPRKTFGTRDLALLERPWPNATTGELLARMEWFAGLAGNAYVLRQTGRLRVLRPDWVGILYGSDQEPDDAAQALDGQIIGYMYQNGGLYSSGNRPHTLLPEDVAHWSPLPDPEMAGLGMSWVTPAVRDIQADIASTQHQINYWANGATPNLVVKGIPAVTKNQFDEIVEMMDSRHQGVANAYRTLYLTAGADATVVGANLADLDLRNSRGGNETRVAMLSRVPATLLQIAEGLAGSSLNAGNFGMARRSFADLWVYPTLQDLCAAVAPLINVPKGAELWTDTADMPLLREDAKDAAEIVNLQVEGITKAVREGFTPESAVAAVVGQNATLLKHTGKVSVQLQEPGAGTTPPPKEPPEPPAARSAADLDGDDELDDDERALMDALSEAGYFDDESRLAGKDVTPGRDQLHHYWTKGKGLAKWVKSPHPWTALYRHLVKYVGPARAKRMASAWHHEVFGIWVGEKKGSNKFGPG